MEENFNNNKLFKDFGKFNNLFSDKEKQEKFFLNIKPLLQLEDIDIANKMGDIHLAIAIWIGRQKEKFNINRYHDTIKKLSTNDSSHLDDDKQFSKQMKPTPQHNASSSVLQNTRIKDINK